MGEHGILDECQYIKIIRTRQRPSIAFLEQHAFTLTGTPILNKLVELYRVSIGLRCG
jgi:SNF2 family DNA or RNA helicase